MALKKTIIDAVGRGTVHPFPARMAPSIALDVLSGARSHYTVLDPMMGSGTVLAVARAAGHRAIGIDIDPLAVLISRVWTQSISQSTVRKQARTVLLRAKTCSLRLKVRDSYPLHADADTKRFIRYWFDPYARKQLTALGLTIRRVPSPKVRDVLWCAFSRLIIAKQKGASLAKDLSHSRPHKFYRKAPLKPLSGFLSAVEHVLRNCISTSDKDRGPAPKLFHGDARHLPIEPATVDLVLTSPPYLNAIDYLRCSKFSLVWMGHLVKELRATRRRSIGSESMSGRAQEPGTLAIIKRLKLDLKLSPRHLSTVERYINDMAECISESIRVLSPPGRLVYVIGENTIRGTYIRNASIVSSLARSAGLRLARQRVRTLPSNRRYLPPPSKHFRRKGFDSRMRREVILVFRKRSAR